MISVYVVEHLPSTANVSGVLSPADDAPIPRRYRIMGRFFYQPALELALGLARATRRPLRIYTSSSPRMLQSAEIFVGDSGIQPLVDERIRPIDYGAEAGVPLPVNESDAGLNEETKAKRLARIETPFEGGESWSQVVTRWRSFLDDTRQTHDGCIALIAGSWGGSRRMLAHLCNDVPLEEALTLPYLTPSCPFEYGP